MKKNYFIIINSILLIILAYSLYNLYKPSEFGENYKQRYNIIEKSLTKIEENMNEMTNDEKWSELNKLTKAEEIQIEGYNMLIQDIKSCYLEYETLDDEQNILSYQKENKISKDNLDVLTENNKCLNLFDKYSDYKFSKEDYLNNKLQNQIKLIMDVKELNKDYKFEDVLIYKSDIMHSVANLASWLKIEYDTYK